MIERRHKQPADYVPYFVAIVVALIAAYAATQAYSASTRIGRDEQQTCTIQKRGLPAGHALARVIGDLHYLVAQPLTAQQQRNLQRYPPKVRFNVLWTYHDLSKQAFNYAWIERRQPKGRSC